VINFKFEGLREFFQCSLVRREEEQEEEIY
jgi:hypothetical protein